MKTWTRALLVCLVWLLGVTAGCDVAVVVDANDVIVCDAASPRCPSSLRCIVAVGRCLPPAGSCIADDGVAPLPDGTPCATGVSGAGLCLAGVCAPSRCGDGRVDPSSAEVCDDGDANRPGWGPAPACTTGCTGPAPTCGDGERDLEEACDDGFRDQCGSCSADCQALGSGPACGDGVVCPELEACDDAGASATCNDDCTVHRCGDGVVNGAAGEVCDDGADNSDDWSLEAHCTADCGGVGRFCGDRVVDPEEDCDEPPGDRCDLACVAPFCGDGVVTTRLGEACDTAGPSATCSAACQPIKALSVGFEHTCLVQDGEAFCFGGNQEGQCGDNPPVVGAPLSTMGGNLRPLPIDTEGGDVLGDVLGVVAGLRFTCAHTIDGRVACFGENLLGQTGSGDPVVDTGGPVTDLAAGRSHVCALREDGSVVCWGENRLCQAGAGHSRPSVGTDAAEMGAALVPVGLRPGRVTNLSAGEFFTCARFDTGDVQCWGAAADGALGQGDVVNRGCVPGELATMPFIDLPAPVASLGASGRHVCALLTTGRVLCWGFNSNGTLGQGVFDDPAQGSFRRGSGPQQMGEFIPTTPLGQVPVLRLSASGTGGHMCALLKDGGVKCWGGNGSGQLGLSDRRPRGSALSDMGDALPRVDLGSAAVAVDVSLGSSRSCARLDDGRVKCWGQHTSGEGVGEAAGGGLGRPLAFSIGDGPGEMGDALPAVALRAACGNEIVEAGEACDDGFRDACGTCNATCSAPGEGAECGDGRRCAESERCDPGIDIDCSDTCTPCEGGRCLPVCPADVCGDGVVCEGREVCDDGDDVGTCAATCDALTPSIHAGLQATCHLDAGGRVRCFGSLGEEQLGRRALVNVTDVRDATVVDLGAARTVQRLAKAAFGRTSCALVSDGSVACWGENTAGQLGTGDVVNRGDDPARMGDSLTTVDLGRSFRATDLAVGGTHACAVSSAGLVKCWGNNGRGRLGQGLVTPSLGGGPNELGDALPPIRLGDGVVVDAISAGLEHTCVLDRDGRVRCFGRGADGRLGRGDVLDVGDDAARLGEGVLPVDLGTTDGVTPRRALRVSAGRANTCAIVEATATRPVELLCWGASFVGLLGIGRPSPATPIGDSPAELGDALVPVDFGGPTPVEVCQGFTHACAILDGGAVRCWGSNTNGRLGFDSPGGSAGLIGDEPLELAAFDDVPLAGPAAAITCGDSGGCARLVDGRFSCWGGGTAGNLGLGDDVTEVVGTESAPLPVLPLP